MSNRVVFTRAVDGVPVVGPGSKVAVPFDNGGQPVGFSYDWSELKATSQNEESASLASIHARREALGRQHIKGEQQSLQLDRMECGYYDLGARLGAGVKLRGACVAHHRVESNDLKSMVLLDAVPASTVIPNEADWPEASRLRAAD